MYPYQENVFPHVSVGISVKARTDHYAVLGRSFSQTKGQCTGFIYVFHGGCGLWEAGISKRGF